MASALSNLEGLTIEPMNAGAVRATWTDGEHRPKVAIREAGDLLVLVAGVCREEDCSPRRVLLAAAYLNGGSAVLIKGKILLRYVLPRDRRDAASVRNVVVGLSTAARRFGKLVVEGNLDEEIFVHYGS
jgi:hypothetical protein